MKIYQIKNLIPNNSKIIYSNAVYQETKVSQEMKDFIKLSADTYASFYTIEDYIEFCIAYIPDQKMIDGELEYFDIRDITKTEYIELANKHILPVWKKINFDQNLNQL